jgi:nucleoside-diphosphate-sugar epimerase
VNVATGRRVSLRMLLAEMARAVGRPAEVRYEPGRAGDVRHSLADIARARRLLGYRPRWNLAEGLERTMAWYRENAPSRSRRRS